MIRLGLVIAAYNAAPYLKATLASLKKQSFKNWECIIVNDGSTDETYEIAKAALRDKRFKRLTQFNAGTAAARNFGASCLSSEVTHLMFLDADDQLLPDALSDLLCVAQACPHAPAVFGLMEFVDGNSKPLPFPDWYDNSPADQKLDWYSFEKFTHVNSITTPGCALIDRRVWEMIGPFDSQLHWIEDWGLWSRVSYLAPIARFRKSMVKYRKHPAQKTVNPAFSQELKERGPKLMTETQEAFSGSMQKDYWYDPLLRTRIALPFPKIEADDVVCTVASAGYDLWLTGLLSSLQRHGNVSHAARVVFNLGNDPKIAEICAAWGTYCIPIEAVAAPGPWSKSILYSAASILGIGRIVCLDADMLVLGDISSLFSVIETCSDSALFVCQDGMAGATLRDSWPIVYSGDQYEMVRLKLDGVRGDSPLTLNDGMLAGSCTAFLRLESKIREVYRGNWDILERQSIRNQFFLNAAAVDLNCVVLLPDIYNAQMHIFSKDIFVSGDNPQNTRLFYHNQEVRIVHYSGNQKSSHPDIHTFYRQYSPDAVNERLEKE